MTDRSSFGKEFRVEISGESHSPYIDVSIYGLSDEETESLDLVKISEFLKRRSPAGLDDTAGALGATARREPDDFSIQSEKPLTIRIFNKQQRSKDYDRQRTIPRPGHADLGIYYRNTLADETAEASLPAGGGAFSGRMTVAMVAAGAVALQVLERRGLDLKITSRVTEVGGIHLEDSVNDSKLKKLLKEAAQAGDSLGGMVEFAVSGLPAGLGGPMAEGLDSIISPLLFAIPGVKSVEFGLGVANAKLKGSESNDPITLGEDGQPKLKTNNCGGMLGGISVGSDITGRVAFKPTPSIEREQSTVDLATMTRATISTEGRHDRCIALRGRVVVEAMLACACLDALLISDIDNSDANTVAGLRQKISAVDNKLQALLSERFELAEAMGRVKRAGSLPIRDRNRERELLNSIPTCEYRDSITNVYEKIMEESRFIQTSTMEEGKQQTEDGQNEKGSFALLGHPIGHSYSKLIFSELGYDYDLLDVDGFEFKSAVKNRWYNAFNVTIPYKRKALELCDITHLPAPEISAVNTICFEGDKVIGYNTDYEGMLQMIGKGRLKGKSVLIIGKGSTGKMAGVLCKNEGAVSIVYKTRNPLTDEELELFTYGRKLGLNEKENTSKAAPGRIVINCSPVGTTPNFFESPIDLNELPECEAVFDVVYNPHKTALAMQAEQLAIPVQTGLRMLVAQALASCEKFTGKKLPKEELLRTIESEIQRKTKQIIFIGMPGSGKTVVGREVASELGRKFYDLDEEIEKKIGRSPEQIICEHGENSFRKLETLTAYELFTRLAKKHEVAVIAFGGGTVLSERAMQLARQTGTIVFIDQDISKLQREGRPLSSSDAKLATLYKTRNPLYNGYCDIKISVSDGVEETAREIIKEWRKI